MRCTVEQKEDAAGEEEEDKNVSYSPPFFSFCCDDWLPGRCRWTHHLSYISIINARWQRHANRAMDMISSLYLFFLFRRLSFVRSLARSLSRQKTFKKQLGYSKVSCRIRHCFLRINTDTESVVVDRLIFEYHSSTRKGKWIGKNNSFHSIKQEKKERKRNEGNITWKWTIGLPVRVVVEKSAEMIHEWRMIWGQKQQ